MLPILCFVEMNDFWSAGHIPVLQNYSGPALLLKISFFLVLSSTSHFFFFLILTIKLVALQWKEVYWTRKKKCNIQSKNCFNSYLFTDTCFFHWCLSPVGWAIIFYYIKKPHPHAFRLSIPSAHSYYLIIPPKLTGHKTNFGTQLESYQPT